MKSNYDKALDIAKDMGLDAYPEEVVMELHSAGLLKPDPQPTDDPAIRCEYYGIIARLWKLSPRFEDEIYSDIKNTGGSVDKSGIIILVTDADTYDENYAKKVIRRFHLAQEDGTFEYDTPEEISNLILESHNPAISQPGVSVVTQYSSGSYAYRRFNKNTDIDIEAFLFD